jgi:hypothetical protein
VRIIADKLVSEEDVTWFHAALDRHMTATLPPQLAAEVIATPKMFADFLDADASKTL